MWLVGLPLAWFFLRQHRPEYYGLLPDGATVEQGAEDTSKTIERGIKYATEVQEVEFTLRQAMRTPTYWLLIIVGSCLSMAGPAFTIHTIPFLTDIGIEPVKAAAMLAPMVAIQLPFKPFGGFFSDRVKKQHLRFLIGGAYALQAAAFGILAFNQSIPMIYLFLTLYYAGLGLNQGFNLPLRSRYFGRKAYGSISGVWSLFTAPAAIASPIYLGWVYDTTGSYVGAFSVAAAIIFLGSILMFFVIPPKPPAQITDIHKIL